MKHHCQCCPCPEQAFQPDFQEDNPNSPTAPPPPPPPPPPVELPWCELPTNAYQWDNNDSECPRRYLEEHIAGIDCTQIEFFKKMWGEIQEAKVERDALAGTHMFYVKKQEIESAEKEYWRLVDEYRARAGACLEKYRKPCDPSKPAPWWPNQT